MKLISLHTRWLLAALLLILFLLAYLLHDWYEQAEVMAASETRNLVQMVESHLADEFKRTDGILDLIASELRAAGWPQARAAVGPVVQMPLLVNLQASFPRTGILTVFDAQGTLRYSSQPDPKRINIADRPHFRRLREDPATMVTFSEAEVARLTGRWSIVQLRALRDAQGRFLGSINAVIDLDSIATLFQSVDVGKHGGVLLRHSDTFKLVQRLPRNNEQDFNQALPKNNATRLRIEAGERAATLTFTASTDGVERLASFKVMEHYPFYVQVAFAKSEYLAAWKRDAVAVGALALLLLLGFALVVRRLHANAQDIAAATQQLAYRQALFFGLFEQSGFLAGVLDASGRVLEINQMALAVIGRRRDDVLGRNLADLSCWSRAEDLAALKTTLAAAALGTSGSFEALHPAVGSGDMTVLFHALPVFVGKAHYIAVTGIDISARKAMEQALERSNADLEQFAYVTSHDLRQPLRMVTSYVQLLERALAATLTEDTREMMHFVSDGAKRMDQMLVSLLEYSRVGRKGEPLLPLNSREAVDEALHFLDPAIQEAQAQIQVSGEWPQVMASRNEFTRLWQNLIGNAVKYRAPGHAPHIEVTVTPGAQGWCFGVADDGIGIDPAQFGRLFKVFQRLHARDQYEGSGIGLAVARKIVERHGGRIWVESAGLGLGCRFCFTLPQRQNGVGDDSSVSEGVAR